MSKKKQTTKKRPKSVPLHKSAEFLARCAVWRVELVRAGDGYWDIQSAGHWLDQTTRTWHWLDSGQGSFITAPEAARALLDCTTPPPEFAAQVAYETPSDTTQPRLSHRCWVKSDAIPDDEAEWVNPSGHVWRDGHWHYPDGRATTKSCLSMADVIRCEAPQNLTRRRRTDTPPTPVAVPAKASEWVLNWRDKAAILWLVTHFAAAGAELRLDDDETRNALIEKRDAIFDEVESLVRRALDENRGAK